MISPSRQSGRRAALRVLGTLAATTTASLLVVSPADAGIAVPTGPGPVDGISPADAPAGWAEANVPALPAAGVRPLPPVRCTVDARTNSVPRARPGDVVCLSGNSSSPLVITTGGVPGRPITYASRGPVVVRGIDVEAGDVVVEGFTSKRGHSMGAKLHGDRIVFQDNTISHPVYTGDDTDGVRFFGDGIAMLHNTITDVKDGSHCTNNGCGKGPHPDCFQTFVSTQYPTSSNVLIVGNRCVDVADQCLMAEGPVLPGDHVNLPGHSSNWVFDENYCDDGANQALMIKNITNVTISDNDFEGTNHKAIALADASTGARVFRNHVNPRIGTLLTFDDDASRAGYVGTDDGGQGAKSARPQWSSSPTTPGGQAKTPDPT